MASSAESAREVLFTHLLHTLHCWPAGRFAHSAAALQQIAKIFRFSNVLLFCSEILPKPMSSIVDVDYVCVFSSRKRSPFRLQRLKVPIFRSFCQPENFFTNLSRQRTELLFLHPRVSTFHHIFGLLSRTLMARDLPANL